MWGLFWSKLPCVLAMRQTGIFPLSCAALRSSPKHTASHRLILSRIRFLWVCAHLHPSVPPSPIPHLRPLSSSPLGIQQDSRHKRRATGGKRASYRKHRKFLLGRQSAHTKLGETRVRPVRTRGGNTKLRALRLDSGIFAWGAEGKILLNLFTNK